MSIVTLFLVSLALLLFSIASYIAFRNPAVSEARGRWGRQCYGEADWRKLHDFDRRYSYDHMMLTFWRPVSWYEQVWEEELKSDR